MYSRNCPVLYSPTIDHDFWRMILTSRPNGLPHCFMATLDFIAWKHIHHLRTQFSAGNKHMQAIFLFFAVSNKAVTVF